MNDDTITIRPADKGTGIVILDTEKYIQQVEDDLEDESTYRKAKKGMKTTVDNKVRGLVKSLFNEGLINDKIKTYMMPRNSRIGRVKANPKMHKQDVPIRTIISGVNHPTERMAEIVEKELDEFVKAQPSYIQDTTHFLKKLEVMKPLLPRDFILFTMDIKALYPSVPKHEGLAACQRALEMRSDQSVTTEATLQMLRFVLDNNIFKFRNTDYIQVDGTAIGSRLGRNYACTYLSCWEEELLDKCNKKPWAYLRYVDDIWGVWVGTEEELKDFHKMSNSIHPRIKVTMECSETNIAFLDVDMHMQEGNITTKIFAKKTDRHLYVHKKSDHPTSMKRSIPYGLGIRAKRICSSNEQYLIERGKIIQNMENRGYTRSEVETSLVKVDPQKRETLLEYRKTQNRNDERVPLVLTYNRLLPNVQEVVHKRYSILQRSKRCREIFKKPPLTSYRRDTNIRDMLIHSKHRKMFEYEKAGTHVCDKRCAMCKHMEVGETFSDVSQNKYVTNEHIDCKSTNVVYGIKCKKCNQLVYVGETGVTVYERFQNHLTTIKGKSDEPVPNHFSNHGHVLEDVRIVGIEKIKNNDILLRKARETFWIRKLGTLTPNGLNMNEGLGD